MPVTQWLSTSRSLLRSVRRASGDTEPRDDDAKIKPGWGWGVCRASRRDVLMGEREAAFFCR